MGRAKACRGCWPAQGRPPAVAGTRMPVSTAPGSTHSEQPGSQRAASTSRRHWRIWDSPAAQQLRVGGACETGPAQLAAPGQMPCMAPDWQPCQSSWSSSCAGSGRTSPRRACARAPPRVHRWPRSARPAGCWGSAAGAAASLRSACYSAALGVWPSQAGKRRPAVAQQMPLYRAYQCAGHAQLHVHTHCMARPHVGRDMPARAQLRGGQPHRLWKLLLDVARCACMVHAVAHKFCTGLSPGVCKLLLLQQERGCYNRMYDSSDTWSVVRSGSHGQLAGLQEAAKAHRLAEEHNNAAAAGSVRRCTAGARRLPSALLGATPRTAVAAVAGWARNSRALPEARATGRAAPGSAGPGWARACHSLRAAAATASCARGAAAPRGARVRGTPAHARGPAQPAAGAGAHRGPSPHAAGLPKLAGQAERPSQAGSTGRGRGSRAARQQRAGLRGRWLQINLQTQLACSPSCNLRRPGARAHLCRWRRGARRLVVVAGRAGRRRRAAGRAGRRGRSARGRRRHEVGGAPCMRLPGHHSVCVVSQRLSCQRGKLSASGVAPAVCTVLAGEGGGGGLCATPACPPARSAARGHSRPGALGRM